MAEQAVNADVLVREGKPATNGWLRIIIDFCRRNPMGAISGAVIITIVAVAIFARYVATHHPTLDADFKALREPPSAAHWMGTDSIGRDLYSRVIHGARISLFVALIAVLVGDLLGAVWGVATGYIGGKFHIYSQRLLELMMSFPTLILAMILVLAMGAGVWTVIVAIGFTRVPLSVRVIRIRHPQRRRDHRTRGGGQSDYHRDQRPPVVRVQCGHRRGGLGA